MCRVCFVPPLRNWQQAKPKVLQPGIKKFVPGPGQDPLGKHPVQFIV